MSEWPNNWPSARATFNATLFASPRSNEAYPSTGGASVVNYNKHFSTSVTRQMELDLISTQNSLYRMARELTDDDRAKAQPGPTEDELVSLEDLPPPPKPAAASAKERKPA